MPVCTHSKDMECTRNTSQKEPSMITGAGFCCPISIEEYSSPPVDIISAMMIVWRIRGKIVRTVL